MTQTEAQSAVSPSQRALRLMKKYFMYCVYLLVAAAVVIGALLVLAPRPDGGFPASHPLAIVTNYVLAGGAGAFALTVAYYIAETLFTWGTDVFRWINTGDFEQVEAEA